METNLSIGSGESRLAALLSHFDAAPESRRDRGRRWYAAAAREVRSIAAETGTTFRRAAAVLAITSPDAQLRTNLAWTRAACANGGETAGRYPNGQRPKVRGALTAPRPSEFVKGPKVSAFYRAILGDPEAVVLDRWACYAAGGSRAKTPSRTEAREIADAYREAASIVGEHVRDLQAIVWLQVRETTARTDGRVHRLADVTL